jgi:hypothetical protein
MADQPRRQRQASQRSVSQAHLPPRHLLGRLCNLGHHQTVRSDTGPILDNW